MSRLLILLPTTSYRVKDFLKAANKLGVEVTIGSNEQNVLNAFQPKQTLRIDFKELKSSVQAIQDYHKKYTIISILGVDEETSLVAAKAAEELNLPHNSFESVKTTSDKFLFRKKLKECDLLTPNFLCLNPDTEAKTFSTKVDYPCVLKPVKRSGSQGVIRANNAAEFLSSHQIISSLAPDEDIIVEDFLPGQEVALEGVLIEGKLTTLAIFDKPDPLDGPYFEETLYVTPSRHPTSVQDELRALVQQAASSIGLKEGPIHAEMRLRHNERFVNDRGPWLIELAARSIGGLCSRSLNFDGNRSLEELIIAHSLNQPLGNTERENCASGVMMIPIPKTGNLTSIGGELEARATKHVIDLQITMKIGQKLFALPKGNEYLGFIFAKASTPEEVEATLRQAHSKLQFNIS